MSNVFKKAIKIAQSRAAWEAEVNPDGEAIVFKKLTEEQLDRSQKMTDDFIAEIGVVAKAAGFKTVEQAKAALDVLDYDTEYYPLWKMSELCIPVNSDTEMLAQAIAPSRVAVVARIREGKFGQYEPLEPFEPMAGKVMVHHAKHQEFKSEPTRGDAAREMQAKRAAVQTDAFKSLAGALGGAMKDAKSKGAKAGSVGTVGAPDKAPKVPKGIDAVMRDLDGKLGGVRVVDGELQRVSAKGQMKLFDEETAPIPKVEKKAKPKAGK